MATNLIGKIILKKKSGPGDITGLTEIDLINDGSNSPNSIFKGIQFTDPGDYVITISSTSKLIDSKDISVKVLPQDLIISQEDRKSDIKPEKNVDGTRPIISQIDKPTIKVKKIETLPNNKQPSLSTSADGFANILREILANVEDSERWKDYF